MQRKDESVYVCIIWKNMHKLRKPPVLSVRNRTQIVRIRTLLCTPKNHLSFHYQQVNVLARFL